MKIPVASYIDHTLLKPVCNSSDINKLCREAIEYGFAAVCVPPFVVKQAVRILQGSQVKTATVIGFPMGYSSLESKISEIQGAIADGADEMDTVINLIALKNGDWSYLEKEMRHQVALVHEKGKIIKVIVESAVLTADELIRCCKLYGEIGIDFMKTSTGYAEKGASISDVKQMRAQLPRKVQIKASGGIRHYAFAQLLIEAGAERLGCSASVQIVDEEKLAS
ncbi:MAG TPA: deoxyribose-phosphate aldolase [Puia sp.]|jgi:deoxyribose-phosphate aldolase